MRFIVVTLLLALTGCGSPTRVHWELHMDGETLNRTFSLKGWCRERKLQLETAYPDHTFECVAVTLHTDFWGRENPL